MNAGTNYADLFYSNIVNDIDTLENNVKEFPCSSVARFLLLYHYKKNNHPEFEKLAKQTGIYINNPLWIQYQFSKIDTDHLLKENNESTFDLINQADHSPENISPAAEEQINQIPVLENVAVEEEKKEDFSESEKQNETIDENISPAVEEQISQIPISENKVTEDEMKEDFSESEKQNETTQENISPAAEEQISQIPVLENEVTEQEKKEDFSENEKQNETTAENISPAAEEQINKIPVSESEIGEQEKKEDFSESEKQNETTEENIFPAAEEQISQIPVSENEVAAEKKEDESNGMKENEELIAFEPLHTVDYFASQGIKISEEALENDHLGKQVKSFTAWLKSMKKLHPGQLPEQNEVIEKIIQASAEVSNQNANVLTEAMAEVLIKQNKKEKAIEMYQKLSLMNPSKSAYFAAKIESLKIV